MKLALLRRKFSATGGAELYLTRLLGALVKAGHEPHLFAEAWGATPEGVTFHPVAARNPAGFARAARAALDRQTYDCVFSLERTPRQDVYRAGDGLHRVWLRRRRQFDPWWPLALAGRAWFHRRMMQLEAATFDPRNTGRVIVNSEMVRREILENFQFPPERIFLVRNGVEAGRFQSGDRAATRARLGVEEEEHLLLFVGSGWERKGLRFLLRAIEKLAGAKVKLLVVGKGGKPRTSPANIIYAGPSERVEDAYAAADLLTMVPIYEPSSNVVVEALVAGLPVITSIHNGAAEILQPGVTGTVLSDPSDIPALVAAIEWWRAKGAGRISVDLPPLSLERNVRETLQVLERAVREKA
jgi:UDP-glucose:(heptosyl)LPS alpha-1,3-glucosyltransferase